MSELRDLYQEVILEHGREPRNYGPLPDANRQAVGNNPLCGDRLIVRLKLDDGRVQDVRFEGSGCAISMASASIMTEMLKGRTLDEAHEMFERFHNLVTGHGTIDGDGMDKLAVFAGVQEFPMRVKCATLAWHTLNAALDGREAEISTE